VATTHNGFQSFDDLERSKRSSRVSAEERVHETCSRRAGALPLTGVMMGPLGCRW
jgi:hypothetical protein